MSETYDVTDPDRPTIVKDPQAVLDYSFDWTTWLADVGDTISDQSVTGQTGITVGDVTLNGGIVTAMVSGGTNNKTYRVMCQITTAGGRTDQRSIYIHVKDR
jgi:pantothenate kinase